MAAATPSTNKLTLDAVRDALIREEDSIIFSLIERAKFPYNARAYDSSFLGNGVSVAEYYVRQAESLQAKVGRYQKPEDVPFFPKCLPAPLPPMKDSQVLLPQPSASVTMNDAIWRFYFTEFLPLFTKEGDDGNYASTVASDFACLQAISRRIHYGKYVAEAKFTDSPQDYSPAISSKDEKTLMNLLTFVAVEEAVKKRVEKKEDQAAKAIIKFKAALLAIIVLHVLVFTFSRNNKIYGTNKKLLMAVSLPAGILASVAYAYLLFFNSNTLGRKMVYFVLFYSVLSLCIESFFCGRAVFLKNHSH